jgi:hypothetical protein
MWALTFLWLAIACRCQIVKDYCPERQKHAYYISDVSGNSLDVQDSCLISEDDGLVLVGWNEYSASARVGLIYKIGHTGDILWSM